MKSILEIATWIKNQKEPKQSEMLGWHKLILSLMPKSKLWYFDGKNDVGKQIAYPTIGYGTYTISYKDGSTRTFFSIGLLANATGLAIHIMGINVKQYLASNFSTSIGKAKIGTYSISFKSIKDIDMAIKKKPLAIELHS